MMEAGWMLVVLVCAVLGYLRVGRDRGAEEKIAAANARVDELALKLSAWPDPEEVLARLDELEQGLESLTTTGATLASVLTRANDLTKDMLELKRLVAEHREIITLLRSKGALRSLTGDVG